MRKSRHPGRRVFFAFAMVWIASGCASFSPAIPDLPSEPIKADVAGIVFIAQKKYHCGPAALAMALQWSGVEADPQILASSVYTPERKGSFQSEMVTAARRHARLAYPIKGMECLIREVASGHPVVVLQNLGVQWMPRWHYAVVVGYDLDRRHVVLHSGEDASRRVGFRTFANTWKRSDHWGLLVLPADVMPQCAEELTYLNAALGLQRAGHPGSALVAFRNAARRWPHSAEANMALGNAYYAGGAIPEAIEAFAEALEIDPANATALNNLAHLLAESGDLETAEAMARRAVGIGGPHLNVYRQTLEEIRSKHR